jgi:hypothetical protein
MQMKKLMVVMVLFSGITLGYLYAEISGTSEQGVMVTNNSGFNKQLQVMEQALNRKGINEEAIRIAKRTCEDLFKDGYTPEECTRVVIRNVRQLHNKYVKEKKAEEEVYAQVRDTLKTDIKDKENIKIQTQNRNQGKSQLKNEIKEQIRISKPNNKEGKQNNIDIDKGNNKNNKEEKEEKDKEDKEDKKDKKEKK